MLGVSQNSMSSGLTRGVDGSSKAGAETQSQSNLHYHESEGVREGGVSVSVF